MTNDIDLIWETYLTEKKKSSFEILKANKIALSEEERSKAIKAGAVWHHGINGAETCAVWKSKDSTGQTWFIVNTHRAYQKSKTLEGILGSKWKFIQSTA
jgi:hypothetical protein